MTLCNRLMLDNVCSLAQLLQRSTERIAAKQAQRRNFSHAEWDRIHCFLLPGYFSGFLNMWLNASLRKRFKRMGNQHSVPLERSLVCVVQQHAKAVLHLVARAARGLGQRLHQDGVPDAQLGARMRGRDLRGWGF